MSRMQFFHLSSDSRPLTIATISEPLISIYRVHHDEIWWMSGPINRIRDRQVISELQTAAPIWLFYIYLYLLWVIKQTVWADIQFGGFPSINNENLSFISFRHYNNGANLILHCRPRWCDIVARDNVLWRLLVHYSDIWSTIATYGPL